MKIKRKYQLNHPASHTPFLTVLNIRNTMTTKMKQIKCDLCLFFVVHIAITTVVHIWKYMECNIGGRYKKCS